MRKTGFKAIVTLLTAGRQKGQINWALSIAIFSSIVTVVLVLLYLMQRAGD